MTDTHLREKYSKSITVTWIDSSSSHGWNYEDDALRLSPNEIRTQGFLIKETDDYVVVSASIANHQIDSPICIPRICITDIHDGSAASKVLRRKSSSKKEKMASGRSLTQTSKDTP